MRIPRPPGALLLAVAIGAGLVTGLSRFGDPFILIPILLASAIVVRRHWWWPGIPAIALGIVVGLRAATEAAQSCAARLPDSEVDLRLHLIDPGAGSGRASVVAPHCSGEVMARWIPGTDHPAGAILDVRARWLPHSGPLGHPDGLLVILRAEIPADGTPQQFTILDRLRTYLAHASKQLYGRRAPLVDALVTGRRGELDPDLKAAFTAAGLVHLLAISGFHVGLLAGWILLALHLLRVPRHPALAAASLSAIAYAGLLGFPAPASRAALLVALYAWCRWRQRQPRPGAVLGLSLIALLLLMPWSITEVGAWLSVVALSGLTAATRWSDREISPTPVLRSVSASLGAVLSTAPFTALVFGQVAPIAILLGVVAGPLAAIIQPTIMASLALAQVAPSLAGALAASGGLLLQAFEAIVRIGATAPGAAEPGDPGMVSAWPWALVLAAAIWAISGRSTPRVAMGRLAVSATCGLWLTLLLAIGTPPSVGPHDLGLFFLDVGQGDAALIRTPVGHWIAVDVGPQTENWSAGDRVVVPFLRKLGGRRLELLVVSHAHRDHIGGAPALIRRVPVGVTLDPAEPFLDQGYVDWLGQLADRGIRWRQAEVGEHWSLDGVGFRILHPPEHWPHRGEDLNEDSIVLEVRYGDFTALLTGDAGMLAESLYVADVGHVDLLKVGHHGSRTATGPALLAATTPRVAVISVGPNNYGHPAPETIARLQAAGTEVWRTDHEGTITVRTDGHTVSMQGTDRTLSFPVTPTALRRPSD